MTEWTLCGATRNQAAISGDSLGKNATQYTTSNTMNCSLLSKWWSFWTGSQGCRTSHTGWGRRATHTHLSPVCPILQNWPFDKLTNVVAIFFCVLLSSWSKSCCDWVSMDKHQKLAKTTQCKQPHGFLQPSNAALSHKNSPLLQERNWNALCIPFQMQCQRALAVAHCSVEPGWMSQRRTEASPRHVAAIERFPVHRRNPCTTPDVFTSQFTNETHTHTPAVFGLRLCCTEENNIF